MFDFFLSLIILHSKGFCSFHVLLQPETHKGLKRVTLICLLCPMLVIIYFESTIFGARRRDNWPIKLRKQRDVILLHVPAPAWKKWPTNGGKTPESRESFQRLKPGILPKNWAGYCCLTTRAKRNITKPFDVLATSWSCHFKKRCLVDHLHSKLIMQWAFKILTLKV